MPVTGHPGPRTDLHKYLKCWRKRALSSTIRFQHLVPESYMARVEFARFVGRPESTIRMWEDGIRRIDIKNLAELARVYGVPPGDLLRPPPETVNVVKRRKSKEPYRYLEDWRLSLGMSRPAMVEKSGFPLKTIANWETGLRSVDLDTLAKLAEFYGVNPWDLLAPPPAEQQPPPVSADPDIQANIEVWRKHIGFTRDEVVERSGGKFSDSSLFEWEKCNRPLPLYALEILSRIYGVEEEQLRRKPRKTASRA